MKLRSWRRQKGEPLAEVADEVERLSRLAYNDAPISTQDNHAKEQCIDAITDDDLRIRILQTRPANLQDALRTALELESYTLAVRRSPTARAVNVSEQEAKSQELTTELMRDMFTEFSANTAKMLGRTVDGRRPRPRTSNAEPEWLMRAGTVQRVGISFAISPTCKTHNIDNNRGQKTKASRQGSSRQGPQRRREGFADRRGSGGGYSRQLSQGNEQQPTSRGGDRL